ncbi:MAG: cbb3-type cytochrome oxidase assembly protein CcoS [Chromatiales bacterium]|nr:cbb3-type cytochrome oxidase assembly protein CcoS [Chromatiales bacterium]MDH3931547.1 cbb3-type cytochrome oxidase assembly protein CcoS [Chromatiales bacterium]MDH4013173.1 cbb3-type cytochrome oxidase assembly protein CcoS [Chromatiales bacterium]PLX56572.1 MAG: cbb3-type cytochrome oxidase assembly protein CcoS [Chromatiales bacterium]
MNILFVLIPLSLVLLALAIWAFFWAVGSGQFDDLDSPGWKILMDDDSKPPSSDQSEKPAPRDDD